MSQTAEVDVLAGLTPQHIALLQALPKYDVEAHFKNFTFIKMKDGVARKPVKCNATQRKMFAAYNWCQQQGRACKLIVLKIRQGGGSETSAQLCWHHSRRHNLGGFVMADIDAHTTKVWDLLKAKAEGADIYPLWGNKFVADSEKATLTFRDANGRAGKAMWDRATAGSSTAGAAGTRLIAWFSESARGAFRGSNVIQNALNSIDAKLPLTLIIAESTAEGTGTGFHFETFAGAVTLEELQAGKEGNGWIQIFVAWHEVEEYALPNTAQYAGYFDDDDARWSSFRDEEQAGVIRYGWTPEQVAWRRWKIVSDMGGDLTTFKRDFPSSPEESWQASGVKRFNPLAVAKLLRVSEQLWERTKRGDLAAPKIGSLIDGPGGVVWSGLREESWLWCCEEPRYGCQYALVVDPASEACVTGTDKRDAHAVGVFRRHYQKPDGQMVPSELVAAVCVPGGCRWDMDILGARIGVLAKWFGNCLVIPELNRPEILPYLQAAKCVIFRRPAPPDMENPSARRQVLGYLTDKRTRGLWVSAAAEAIREELVWCRYLPAVREFDTFIVNDDGKAEAASGAHDDWVAMFGIGCQNIDAATRMAPPLVQAGEGQWRPQQQRAFARGSAAIG